MTSDGSERRIRIYLADHLAVMLGEAELAQRCLRSNEQTALGEFLGRLHVEVQGQRAIVKDVLQRLGGRESLLKDSGAWVAEKLGRLKLNDTLLTYSSLSRLIELEGLSAAACARVMLWDNLVAMAERDSRLEGISCSFFRQQSQQHLDELDTHRRRAASEAF